MERPTLRQLEYFVAVAERLNFSKAAESCFVSQPALSAQIAQLEALIGIKLFERDRRGVQLTVAGDSLVSGAKETLRSCDRFGQFAQSLCAPLSGPLRLGVIPTIGPYLLPQILPAISESYPELQLFLREDMTSRLLEQLAEGKLDLLLLATDIDLGAVTTLNLFSDPFVLGVSVDDELASLEEVALSHLSRRNVLLLDEGHCFREQTLSLCESAGADEFGGFRASSLGTITQMVANGLGITLLPELAIEREAAAVPRLHVIPFGADGPFRSVGLAWRPNSPRGEEFRALGTALAEAYARS
ncbi:MAG: LysR family hydrogen peroxide-inducible transcriptional activator [Planctomycetota bacterium]|jgi:LysR family hydrogen peroxide-inducible transcriptional activator